MTPSSPEGWPHLTPSDGYTPPFEECIDCGCRVDILLMRCPGCQADHDAFEAEWMPGPRGEEERCYRIP